MARAASVVSFLAFALLAACSRGPDAAMRGRYENKDQKATLEVTADKMVASGGPLTITADYKVLSVSGSDVTVELTAPHTPKGTLVVTVRDDALVIKDNLVFGGTWTRK